MKRMLTQVTMALTDAVSLPWPAVRSAWAASMTQVEEGRLSWANNTQWALNRYGMSQVAVFLTVRMSPTAEGEDLSLF